MQLAQPACVRLGRLAGMEVRSRRAPDVEREVEGLVDRLHGGAGRVEAAFRDARDVPALVRELLAAREVDARDLEQRDLLVALVLVVGRLIGSLPASTLTLAASTSPCSNVVRRTAWSPLIGSGSRSAPGSGSVAVRLQVYASE